MHKGIFYPLQHYNVLFFYFEVKYDPDIFFIFSKYFFNERCLYEF